MTDSKISLDALFLLQAALDEEIAKNHNVDYDSTFSRRVLALLVELGEFANETRCFKYWSYKGPSPKETILDEYADGMHFFLSLGVMMGVTQYTHHFHVREKDLTQAILNVYEEVVELYKDFDPSRYVKAFGDYLNIIPLFDYSSEEVLEAYVKKCGKNHVRQETHY